MVLPVFWYNKVQNEDLSLQKDLNAVTLKTVPFLRKTCNGVALDVLFYSTPKFLTSIVEETCLSMNRSWKILKSWCPHLKDDSVAIIGHSLGSVIGFDLLQGQSREPEGKCSFYLGDAFDTNIQVPRLDFWPKLYISCGSPLGMFLATREDKKSADFCLPTCTHYLNVFHPFDPIAFRMEPCFDRRLANLEPEIVPHVGGDLAITNINRFGKSLSGQLNKLKRWNIQLQGQGICEPRMVEMEEETTEEDLIKISQGVAVNKGGRVDFQMQDGAFITANQYLGALSSHSCYLFDEDFALLTMSFLFFGEEME